MPCKQGRPTLEPPPLIVIGLTGGIASGKSYVAGRLAERGAVVLDADRHAQAALDEPRIRDAIVARWGEEVLDGAGRLDRQALASRVFGDAVETEANRRFLEGLVHPFVRARLREELSAAREAGAPAAVLDVPLLLEVGWAEECDAVIFVDTPTVQRAARAAERGWSEE